MRHVLMACALACLGLAWTAARAEPPPIEAYARFPTASRLSLSPSGKRAAFLINSDKGFRVYVQDVGAKVIASVDVVSVKLRSITWAGEDHLLVTTSSTINLGMDFGFKHELANVQVLDLKTLKVMSVFQHTPRISNVVFGTYGVAEKAGRWYGYFGGITLEGELNDTYLGHGYPDLYEVDLETGAEHMAARGNDRGHTWLVGPDGEVIAHSEYDEKKGDWKLLVGPGSAGLQIMARNTPLDDVALLGQGRTPGTVLVEDSSGKDTVYDEVSLKDGKVESLLGDYSITDGGEKFDQNTGLFLGAEVRGPERAVLFDPALQAKVRGAFKAFPGHQTHLVDYDPSFDEMIVLTDGADDSGTYWYVDIPKRSAIPLGDSRPDVPAAQVGPTRMFAYKASDGLALEGVLTLPPGRDPKNLPVVLMPHGGPLDERDELGFDWWAQAYASRGYAVFQPNYRGSGGYGLAFMHLGYGEWGRKMLSDIADGGAALAAQGIVDPKRACIVGASYGGYAALAGVTLQQGLYRCAVSVAGVSDMPALREWELDREGDGDNVMRRSWRTAVQGEGKDEPGLAAISPARLADRADAPVLLIHGKDDTVVPIEQSRKMEGALRGANKPVALIVQPGGDHWLSTEDTRIQTLKAAVEFVEKYNPPS